MERPDEEVRKLQVTGKSTYIVSLPKKWVDKLKLKAGDKISITEQEDSSLVVVPPSLKKPEEAVEATVRVSPDDEPSSIYRKIVSLYLAGYGAIHVSATGDKLPTLQREMIKNLVRGKLIGTEIMVDSASEMTIQVLLKHPELSVKGALRRMSTLASTMHKDAMLALESFDKKLAESVINTDDEIDRFNIYLMRQLEAAVKNQSLLKEVGLSSSSGCLGYRLVTKSVERVGDHAARIAEKVKKLKKAPDKELLNKISLMSTFSNTLFEESISALFREDYDLAEKVIAEKESKIESLEDEVSLSALKERFSEDIVNLRLIAGSLRRIAGYSADIAEVVLNLTVEAEH
jgi:phosphate uptake regulator